MKKFLFIVLAMIMSMSVFADSAFSIAGGGAVGVNSDFDTSNGETFLEGRMDIGDYGFMAATYLGQFDDDKRWQAGLWAGGHTMFAGVDLSAGVGLQRIDSDNGHESSAEAVRAGIEVPFGDFGIGAHFMRTFSDDYGNFNTAIVSGRYSF